MSKIGMVNSEMGTKPLAILFGKQAVNVLQTLRADVRTLDRSLQKTYATSVEDTCRRLADWLISEGRIAEAQEVLDLLKNDEYFRFLRAGAAHEVDLTPREKMWAAKYDVLGGDLAKAAAEQETLWKKLKADKLTADERKRMDALGKRLTDAQKAFAAFLDEAKAAFAASDGVKERLDDLKSRAALAKVVDA